MADIWYILPPGASATLAPRIRAACADHPHTILEAAGPAPVQARLAQAEARRAIPQAICLIGPAEALPHGAFDDATGFDPAVLTDNDYGSPAPFSQPDRFGPDGLPAVPVCRIPTLDGELVERLLSVRDVLPAGWEDGVGLTCARWAGASAAALAAMGGDSAPLLRSPPLGIPTVASALPQRPRRIYANLHGSDQAPAWFGDQGDGQMPEALRPTHLAHPAPNALLLSEACYGARHEPDVETVAMRFLRGGGSAMVGSTVVAWGPISPPIGLADVLIVETLRAFDAGATLPQAVQTAREAVIGDKTHLLPQEANTIASFIALGGPLARVARSHVHRPAPPNASLLNRVRAARDARGGGGPLGAARARLRAAEARGQWRAPARLHLSLAELRARFATAADLQARLRAALGTEPATIALVEYEAPGGFAAQLIAAADLPFGRHAVALILGAGGQVEQTLSTRTASAPR